MDRCAHRGVDALPLPLYGLKRAVARQSLSLALVLIIAALCRIPGLVADVRFHPDEALYATFAREILQTNDFLLIGRALDKPPLHFFAVAGTFAAIGQSEFTARLPACFASLISIAALYAIGQRLYGVRIGLLVALLLAGSPVDRAFAASAFTDPLLTMFILLALLASVRGRWSAAGLLCAAAFATKPSALGWLPLVLLVGWTAQGSARGTGRGLVAAAVGLALLIAWSIARDTHPDFWALNGMNNTPDRLIRSDEVIPRAAYWLGIVWAACPLAIAAWVVPLLRPLRTLDRIIAGYAVAVIGVYWLVAFNTYDRYLLPLVPLLLLMSARLVVALYDYLARRWRDRVALLASAAFVVWMLAPLPVTNASQAGIDDFARDLNALPAGTIIYEHWLGWELGWYLGSAPNVRLVWLPSVADLIVEAQCSPVYIIGPQDDLAPWLDEMHIRGFVARTISTRQHFVLMQVAQPFWYNCRSE